MYQTKDGVSQRLSNLRETVDNFIFFVSTVRPSYLKRQLESVLGLPLRTYVGTELIYILSVFTSRNPLHNVRKKRNRNLYFVQFFVAFLCHDNRIRFDRNETFIKSNDTYVPVPGTYLLFKYTYVY